MKTVRIVLQDTVCESDVDSAAWDNDWSLIRTVKADENTPHQVIWESISENVKIHYIEDFYIGLPYCVVRGDEVELVVEDIHATLPTYTENDVFNMLENFQDDQDNLIKAIYCLGLVAPTQFDLKFFALFNDLLLHSNPMIRSAVITAIGYVGWKAFKSLLESFKQSDSDAEVRKDAEVMLSGFELYVDSTIIASY